MTAPVDASTRRAWPEARDWHALRKREVLELLSTGEDGLTGVEARARLEHCGANRLPVRPPPGAIEIALRQLKSPLIYVLLAAAAAATALGDLSDAAFIGVVLLLNSSIGGWQEWRAEQQSQGLQQLLRIRATVLRDGESLEIDGADVVPGDIVALESGQRVPADLRLLDAQGLEIDEALLTGESLPVLKDASWIGPAEAGPADSCNMAFAGTTVARGRGHGVVVATGGSTAVGRLAISISAADAGKPPLVERMERFSRVIAVAVLSAALLIGAVAVLMHGASVTQMFMFGVALAVSAIPEGLPVAITIALAIAARRMAARNAIVRRLPAVEGLGSCTLRARDKTGTQTCNILPLYFEITPEDRRQAVLQNILRDIQLRGDHLSTGFLGTTYLMALLNETHNNGLAWKLASQALSETRWRPYGSGCRQPRWEMWIRRACWVCGMLPVGMCPRISQRHLGG